MKVFYPDSHREHHPPFEGYTEAGNMPSYEIPERVDQVLKALKDVGWVEMLPPEQFSLDPILAVHSPRYLAYLESAYEQWENLSPVAGMAFIPGTYGITAEDVIAGTIPQQAGFFLLDTTVAINAHTYRSALASASCALSGAQVIMRGDPVAFALCRPPGHHAGREICGGYCFLNNAAIAAQWLSHAGKVAILDIDYHAGNGTQEIFYERPDVFTVSLHADPQLEYPRYAGYTHETGSGLGTGYHLNFPLPPGVSDPTYLSFLEQALDPITQFAPKHLVVSAGLDLYLDDPLGDFAITRQGIHSIGKQIAQLKFPTLIVMEGGYHIPSLGENMLAFLSAFDAET